MPMWPDLDASLDCDAGWRQRFLEADRLGRCRPVARPVFHSLAGAVFGPDGALARLASGAVVAVFLEAGGVGLVLARSDDPAGEHAEASAADAGEGNSTGGFTAALLPAGRPRPTTAGELWAVLADAAGRPIGADPATWPTFTTCR